MEEGIILLESSIGNREQSQITDQPAPPESLPTEPAYDPVFPTGPIGWMVETW